MREKLPINDVGKFGAVVDISPSQLPPEVWTTAHNMRMRDGSAERLKGYVDIFPGALIAPHFLFPLRTTSQTFWLYTSLAEAAVYDGSTHAPITRPSGNYTASQTRDWNGTLLGGVPILNNGSDVPQTWSGLSTAERLRDLENWPSTMRARIVRALGPFLVAFNIVDNTNLYPHMVWWSHPADPGSVPKSWDYTDPRLDAGRLDLTDVDAGVILDALQLGSAIYIYKEGSVWRMTFVGGRLLFDFKPFLETIGILGPRCVCLSPDGDRHVFMTKDDVIEHNGNSHGSILQEKWKKQLFAEIDPTNYYNSFLFANPLYNEVWICYPTTGNTHPNKALIYNTKSKTITTADVAWRYATTGAYEVTEAGTWDAWSGTWDSETDSVWGQLQRRRVIAAVPATTQFLLLDETDFRGGLPYTATLQRVALGITGKKRNGEWITDFHRRKLALRVWPKGEGGPLRVRLGSQQQPKGPVVWGDYFTYDPITQRFVDPRAEGVALAIEFSTDAGVAWKLDGYELEVSAEGEF